VPGAFLGERAERGNCCSVASCALQGRMPPNSVGGRAGHGAGISWRGARIFGRGAQGVRPLAYRVKALFLTPCSFATAWSLVHDVPATRVHCDGAAYPVPVHDVQQDVCCAQWTAPPHPSQGISESGFFSRI